MELTRKALAAQLVVEQNAKNLTENALDAKIKEVNEQVRTNKRVDEEGLKKAAKELVAACEWFECLDLLVGECDRLKVAELTPSQVKTALVRVRNFPAWKHKKIKDTGCFKKDSQSTNYDITSLLEKLGIDTSYKYEFQLFNLFLTLCVGREVSAVNSGEILAGFRRDKKVEERIKAGADLSSKRTVESALKDAVIAFLPELEEVYKVGKADAAFIKFAATSVDRRSMGPDKKCKINMVEGKKFANIVYDHISSVLANGGTAQYIVGFKKAKDKATEEVKPEAAAETPAAPAEEKPAEEVAAKPVKKPAPKKAADKTTVKKTTKRTTKKAAEEVAA